MALFKNKLKSFQEQTAQEKQALQQQIEHLQKQNEALAKQNDHWQQQTQSLQAEVQQLQQQGKKLEEQNTSLQQIQEASEEIARELRNKNGELQKQLALLQVQIVDHKVALAQSQQNTEAAHNEQALLKQKNKHLRKVFRQNKPTSRPLKGKKMPEKFRHTTVKTPQATQTPAEESTESNAMTHNALGQVKTQAEFQNVPVNMGNRMITPRVRRR
ncbi:hypothetical protein [uncultured Microscilla sp.]|uniref:hypothetical protein n=1 Tax=uncultured Microscilla sp. TaxID=432653 RepID=UPI00262FF9DE|nr:hypothetical protein [uncultured Microscilla sp.]